VCHLDSLARSMVVHSTDCSPLFHFFSLSPAIEMCDIYYKYWSCAPAREVCDDPIPLDEILVLLSDDEEVSVLNKMHHICTGHILETQPKELEWMLEELGQLSPEALTMYEMMQADGTYPCPAKDSMDYTDPMDSMDPTDPMAQSGNGITSGVGILSLNLLSCVVVVMGCFLVGL